MEAADLAIGEEVLMPWGPIEYVQGTVREIYGRPPRTHVVVVLDPETTEYVVDEPTTFSMPIDDIRKIEPAR